MSNWHQIFRASASADGNAEGNAAATPKLEKSHSAANSPCFPVMLPLSGCNDAHVAWGASHFHRVESLGEISELRRWETMRVVSSDCFIVTVDLLAMTHDTFLLFLSSSGKVYFVSFPTMFNNRLNLEKISSKCSSAVVSTCSPFWIFTFFS